MHRFAILVFLLTSCVEETGSLPEWTPEPSDPTAEEPDPQLLRINELMAVAADPIVAESEERPDWVEIENVSDDTVDLDGWFLSDDPNVPTAFALPAVSLEAGERVVIVASDRPVVGIEDAFRAPFNLKADGEFLAIVEPSGLAIHDGFAEDYPEQRYGVSYGFDPVSGENRYFSSPSPGATNGGDTWLGFAADPVPSVPRGFFEEPLTVSLSAELDAQIHLTTDAARPEIEPESAYIGPLEVEGTTLLRAVATRPEHLPSHVVTHTYLFMDDVLTQPVQPDGYPATWQPNVTADYAVDTSVGTAEDITEALRSFPTLSLVMPIVDWFHPDNDPDTGGIYSNSTIARGPEWERHGSAEFFDFEHGIEHQSDAGIRVYGNASRTTSRPKHNLRLVFRREYGRSRLDFPLFGDDNIPESVNGLLLRGQNGDSWIHPNGSQQRAALYMRDQLARSLHERMGATEIPQGHINLYINGLYWGLYNTIERITSDSMAMHFGGYEEDWDVIKSSRNPNEMQVVAGSLNSWTELQDLAAAVGAGTADFSEIEQHLDVDRFADFLLVNFYNGNRDWDDNNFLAAKRRTDGDRWRFFVWDSERTLLAANHNSVNKDLPDRATAIHQNLRQDPTYQALFSARIALHLGDGGTLSPSGVDAEFRMWVDVLRIPLLAESARWGDAHRNGNPRTVDGDWQTEVDHRLDSYIPGRTATVLNQLANQGLE